jgi:SAM-dependent methyltransferase
MLGRFFQSARSQTKPEQSSTPDSRPAMPRHGELRDFVLSLDSPDEGNRRYLDIHQDRIATTLSLVPPPFQTHSALELGAYMQMTPALGCVLGYRNVRGGYFGPLGKSDRKQSTVGGKVVFECWVDCFDAEKDTFPYQDGSFDCVLACEIFEHLLHDPMHLLVESNRVLVEGGALILTTPNVASATAVKRTLEMSGNPQLYSKYADPRGEYAETEVGHMREYTPGELTAAIEAAGFKISWLFTTYAPGYHSHTEVLGILERLGYATALRGEQMYCVAEKRVALPITRYPEFLYE